MLLDCGIHYQTPFNCTHEALQLLAASISHLHSPLHTSAACANATLGQFAFVNKRMILYGQMGALSTNYVLQG